MAASPCVLIWCVRTTSLPENALVNWLTPTRSSYGRAKGSWAGSIPPIEATFFAGSSSFAKSADRNRTPASAGKPWDETGSGDPSRKRTSTAEQRVSGPNPDFPITEQKCDFRTTPTLVGKGRGRSEAVDRFRRRDYAAAPCARP